jgi:putative nucleotidyltransferase with HDIG domain
VKIPTVTQAERYLTNGEVRRPGPWVQHSVYVARAARSLAEHLPELVPDDAYVLGLLHDIGRQAGDTDLRHALDGFRFLEAEGFPDAARICLTHSLPAPLTDLRAAQGRWDVTPAERRFIRRYLGAVTLTPYDRLIQLCDLVALPSGPVLVEQRLVDIALRRGLTTHTLAHWQAALALRQVFEAEVGGSVYRLIPDLAEHALTVRGSPLSGTAGADD